MPKVNGAGTKPVKSLIRRVGRCYSIDHDIRTIFNNRPSVLLERSTPSICPGGSSISIKSKVRRVMRCTAPTPAGVLREINYGLIEIVL